MNTQPKEITMSTQHEVGDAAAEIDSNLRDRLDTLIALTNLAKGEGTEELNNDEMLRLGIAYGQPGPIEPQQIEEEAAERLDEYGLGVQQTVTFEIVLGTGGPDDRLLFECWPEEPPNPNYIGEPDYEIHRVLYRYSWTGTADRVLAGQDRDAAIEYARRVVPELVE
jgi:hypothetical protein